MTRDLYGHEAMSFDMAGLPIAAPPVVQAQFSLPFATNQMERPERREELIAQWYVLVRDVLPEMARRCRWPISDDHCFMRVCLDASLGAPWHTTIQAPAIRHLSLEQLENAIAIAESIISNPDRLWTLNHQSIDARMRVLAGREIYDKPLPMDGIVG